MTTDTLTPRQSAELVRQWLARTGLGKSEAARALGISRSWLAYLLAGRRETGEPVVLTVTLRRAMRDIERNGLAL